MLSNQKWAVYAIGSLIIGCTIAPFQLAQAKDEIATVSSIKKAPYSQVFYTGSIYAVRDHDYKGSEPKIGVSTLWSKNSANGNLSLRVRYCVPSGALIGSTASLSKLVLLSNNQSLVTIAQPVQTTPSYQRVIQNATAVPGLGFWDSDTYWGNDAFWDGIDEPFWSDAATLPSVTCSAGSSQFNIDPLANTIAQLPDQTLQMKLIFSNGETSDWKLGQKTVQALKDLLAVGQTSMNSSQTPSK
ncbi:hypothetical protein ACE1CI_23365 [Aerosakkonemataceae cyanobacterium BLCC-F50]|uniref:Uncharacterized protein n=2 Tax=Floridanema TaxID=3396149 RepID=A0ABV4XVU2_9CYAN